MFKTKKVFRAPPLIEEDQVIRCLAAEVDGLPIFESALTVIKEHREDLIEGANSLVSDAGKLAANTGGVYILDLLRDNLLAIRNKGRKDS